MALFFSDDVDPRSRDAASHIEIVLSVEEQKKFVEAKTGEPCFRMWMSKAEFDRAERFDDWTHYDLCDGRIAIWRKESDLANLQKGGEIGLWRAIMERRLADDVI